jgi:two-component system, sensor histidine kinase and response regulator
MAKYDILLIGDGTNLLNMIGWVLEYKGYAVTVTACPEAALEALVTKNYDLVVAKVSAADLDGVDILRRARRLNPAVKVMAISGNQEGIFPLEAFQVDVDDYILMPVSPAELWRRVNRCLEDLEVVDLQPVRHSAGPLGERDQIGAQMALMLHDIRGAMVSTAASLKLMARATQGEMSERAKVKLHEATDRFDKMIRLTEDFIGKSLTGRRLKGRDGDVLDLAQDVIAPVLAELAPEIREQQITLVNRLDEQQEGKIPVRANKLSLKCVFRNLMNNGIKYGGPGCTIFIDCETQGSTFRLSVHNTGQTVPEDNRAKLFSYGRNLWQSPKSRHGLGLGLPLSRDIIQNHGGDIWYEPKSDGSNFVVSLPQ